MSVSTLAHPPHHGAALTKFWLGVIFLIVIAIGLAWIGTAPARDQLDVQTLQAGTGPLIKPVDGIIFEYEGRLPNGKVFDSTAGRGPQPMIAGQSLPGFVQALSHMQKGGRYRIHIPAKLAYGASPPPGSPIPANSDLDFDVHIVQVVPNAAAMVAQEQAAQEQAAQAGQPGVGQQPGAGESALPQGQ